MQCVSLIICSTCCQFHELRLKVQQNLVDVEVRVEDKCYVLCVLVLQGVHDESYDLGWFSGYPGSTFQYRVPARLSVTRVSGYPLRTLAMENACHSETCDVMRFYLRCTNIEPCWNTVAIVFRTRLTPHWPKTHRRATKQIIYERTSHVRCATK